MVMESVVLSEKMRIRSLSLGRNQFDDASLIPMLQARTLSHAYAPV